MTARPGLALIIVVLAGLLALCLALPEAMLAPGPVMPAHRAIAADCFACHAPLQGAAASRCIACHTPARIGRFTVAGQPRRAGRAVFHGQLTTPDCLACHSDHAGPALTGHSPASFSHQLLPPAVRGDCAGCHRPPARGRLGALHKAVAGTACSTCHSTRAWEPARFRHAALAPALASQCSRCHTAPGNALHRGIGTLSCSQCHGVAAWEPARFAHDRLFRLDGAHAVPCATCHTGPGLSAYSCYGCHAHAPAATLALHRAEGIGGSITDCARCHRSGDEEEDD